MVAQKGSHLRGENVDGVFQPGVPVGTKQYATSHLWGRARKIVKDAKKTVDVLGGERCQLASEAPCETWRVGSEESGGD